MQSYSATTMQDIADELSIKASSLYNHIASKQDILSELLLTNAVAFVNAMEEIKNSSLEPIDKIKKLIALHVRMTTEDTNKMSLMTNEWKLLDEKNKKEYLKHRAGYEKDFKEILKIAKDANQINDINIDIAMFSMLSTLRWIYSWYDKNQSISTIDLELHLYESLLTGIAAK